MKDPKAILSECVYCGGTLRRGTAPFHADRAGYHVHWDALPAWVCVQCGEPLFESKEVETLQAALATLDQHTLQIAGAQTS